VIYVQQTGFGQRGTYQNARAFGPTAAAFSGISELSGLPDPYPPAGIGYSYLDWFGAYNMATAMMAALYRQRRTGLGCHIDSSQVETGTYLCGTAVLDYSVNGRPWRRTGNRSPAKPAAPHGVYRVAGVDRWIAIACFNDDNWRTLVHVLGMAHLLDDPRVSDKEQRLRHGDLLDDLVAPATSEWEGYVLMDALQAGGVPSGVCQTAEDRMTRDPQLAHLDWLVELPQPAIGRWPVKEIPVHYSETPPYIGGTLARAGPNYGQDNDLVYGGLLGRSPEERQRLRRDGVI
jgi:crotonobetainyl-CoA:carnitine CoA-transferase CaiB-like acyl-CoA transferase